MRSYSVSSEVDPANTIIETNNGNNTFTSSSSLVVAQSPGPDLQVLSVTINPQSPSAGMAVSFIHGTANDEAAPPNQRQQRERYGN